MTRAILILLLLVAGCSRPPERNMWREYFNLDGKP